MALIPQTKRKRPDDVEAADHVARPKKNRKQTSVDTTHKHEEPEVIPNSTTLDPQLIADHIAKQSARFSQDLSTLELEELRVPVHPIIDTTEWPGKRNSETLVDFLHHYTEKGDGGLALAEASPKPGMPHTLVVSMSGLRAADLTRALRVLQTKEAIVSKLFAKHIKLKEAVVNVKKTRISIGVGTPTRIIDLLTSGSLRLDCLARIVIDMSHVDKKKRSIVDMKETQRPLVKLLSRSDIRGRYDAGPGAAALLFF